MVEILRDGPSNARHVLLLAHGAGAPVTSDWMEAMTSALNLHGIAVCRFEFSYMAARRAGVRRPPPKAERLCSEYVDAINAVSSSLAQSQRLFVGGKSLGGRVASLIAADMAREGRIAGLVCLGYPFHPPKKPLQLRTEHLAELDCPTLILQGERDALGSRADVLGYQLSPAIEVAWLGDGDHDWKPRVASGLTQAAHMEEAAEQVARFCECVGGASR